jgi:malto-oligosyltrehalose trehalohydrolase
MAASSTGDAGAGFGASLIAHDATQFRFWAPSLSTASVEVEGMAPVVMQSAGEGWFEAVVECGAGARYKYRVSPDLAVPDPASRAQAGDVHDASLVVDLTSYSWLHPEWRGRPWHETVLYELHVGVAGGFTAAAARLPELAALGITAVELMPINDFPGKRNWGYDGVLPYAPDAAYGAPDELKALIDAAHGLGVMVFLDVVYNHFGPDGNYLSAYAKDFFREDIKTPWGPAIDFRRPQVRSFFAENALYWLEEFNFDGLRFDAVHAIADPDWLDEMAGFVRAAIGPSRHVHLVLENETNGARHLAKDFNAQWNDDGHNILHRMLTGETEGYYEDYTDRPAERLARFLKEGFVYQGEASQHKKGALRGEPSGYLPPTAFVLFLQNHDQTGNRALGERLITLAPPEALRAAYALLLLGPQIPMLFMGEEFGATTPFFFFTDHHDELADAVREGRRNEFAHFAAFSDPVRREKIPDPNAATTFTGSDPFAPVRTADSETWLSYIGGLLKLRAEEIVPRLKGARAEASLVIGEAAVRADWRLGDGSLLTIFLNLGPVNAVTGELPGVDARLLAESRVGAGAALQEGSVPAESAVVWLEAAGDAVGIEVASHD